MDLPIEGLAARDDRIRRASEVRTPILQHHHTPLTLPSTAVLRHIKVNPKQSLPRATFKNGCERYIASRVEAQSKAPAGGLAPLSLLKGPYNDPRHGATTPPAVSTPSAFLFASVAYRLSSPGAPQPWRAPPIRSSEAASTFAKCSISLQLSRYAEHPAAKYGLQHSTLWLSI